MADTIRIFRSPQKQAEYYAAYDAMLARWPVPYQELYIPTHYGRTHVIASGARSSRALILLHSAGSGAVQWFRNIGPLSERRRTFAVDVIGEVNRSITERRLAERAEFVEWMRDLLDGLEVERADWVGNSFGGMLVCMAALDLPERVGKIVLISPAATFTQIWAWYSHLGFPYKIGYRLGWRRLMLSGYRWLWQGFPRDDLFARYSELGKTNGFPANQLAPPVYSDAELRSLCSPVLLLIGDHEVIYDPARVMARARRLVGKLRAELVPDANHNAQVTAPEPVNRMILEFLEGDTH